MDIVKLMETFVRVVDLGTYSHAARHLQLTPAMISKRMLNLEQNLGVKLLNRSGHSISLTSAGQEYYDGCLSVISRVQEIHERLTEKQHVVKGDLKIISAKTFGEHVLARTLSQFSQTHRQVQVNMVLRDMSLTLEELLAEGFDLLIRTRGFANPHDASLVVRKIVSLPRVLVASPDYLKSVGMPRAPSDLKDHNCLNPNGFGSEIWTFTRGKSSFDVRASGFPLANSSIVIRTACEQGLGIAMLSKYTIEDSLSSKRLVQVLPEFDIPSRALFVFYNRTRYLPARSRLFIDYLSNWMKHGAVSPK